MADSLVGVSTLGATVLLIVVGTFSATTAKRVRLDVTLTKAAGTFRL